MIGGPLRYRKRKQVKPIKEDIKDIEPIKEEYNVVTVPIEEEEVFVVPVKALEEKEPSKEELSHVEDLLFKEEKETKKSKRARRNKKSKSFSQD